MKEFDAPKLIKLQKDNTLSLDLNGLKERRYGVSVKYYDHSESKPYKRIDYNNTIYINKHSDGWLMDINKENIYFNQHEPNLVSENIGSLVSKSIYPIQTCIDKSGIPLNGVTNHNQILNRWERNKSAISKKYIGEATDSLLNYFNKKISNKVRFEQSMDHDMFWNLLFHPKYVSYQEGLKVKTNFLLAILPYHPPIEFSGMQKLNPEITDYNSIRIDFISDEIEAHPYFKSQENNSEPKYLMRLKVHFDLDIYYLFPMHARVYFEVYSKDEDSNESILKKINFTQYQLNAEDNKTEPQKVKSMFEVTGNESKSHFKRPKKKITFMDYIYDILGG